MGGGGGGGFRGTRGSKSRTQHGKTPINNQAQNAQFKKVIKKLGLTKKESERLHREISKKGYSYQVILELARALFDK